MAIYALGDLHLSLGTDKPMDVFGGRWENYTEKIYENWQSIVGENDAVIIPGDVSWATYLENSYDDFKFIDELNGRKIIMKGNHDYWWTTMRKMENYFSECGFTTISLIHNNAVWHEDTAVCGTRGWYGGSENPEDEKILDRERKRLILSLEAAVRLKKKRIVVGMHYPPIDITGEDRGFIEIMKNYGVSSCVYGHLHSYAHRNAVVGEVEGIELKLVSGDFVNFSPILV